MKHLILSIFVAVVFLAPMTMNSIFGQSQRVEFLTPKDGLSQGYIFYILQDNEGYIWASTKNGLNRYDGYRFKVFTHDPYDPYSLTSDVIIEVKEYKDYIVLKCENGIIQFLNKHTHKVYRLPLTFGDSGIPFRSISYFFIDFTGTLWFNYSTKEGNVIYSCKIPDDFWTSSTHDPAWADHLKLTKHTTDIPGVQIITLPNLQDLILKSKDKILLCKEGMSECSELFSLDGASISSVVGDDKDGLWISYKKEDRLGIVQFEKEKSGLSYKQPVHYAISGNYMHLIEYRSGLMWMELDNAFVVFDLGLDNTLHSFEKPQQSFSVISSYSSLIIDNSGILWIGTKGNGIQKINPRARNIYNMFKGESIYGYIHTDSNGSIVTNNSTGVNLLYISNPTLHTSILIEELKGFGNVNSLVDSLGNTWALGLNFPELKLKLIKIGFDGKVSSYPVVDYYLEYSVFALDKEGVPWIVVNNGLLKLDEKKGSFVLYEYDEKHPLYLMATSLVKSKDGKWFIGTNIGLLTADIKDEKAQWKLFQNDISTTNSLRKNDILSLLLDPVDDQVLWIGTNGGGLNRLDLKNMDFKHFRKKEGFPNDVIYGILSDDKHNLWMSSNSGLIAYSPNTGRIRNYTSGDGTQGYEFNRMAYTKSREGMMYFGGVNGLTVIDPAIFSAPSVIPTVVINTLLINGEAINWNEENAYSNQEKNFPHKISIPYNQNNLSFEFAVMDYIAPTKNRFRYYLQGAETEWAHESNENSASYLNLKPGTYIFKVLGSNSDGIWSDYPAEMMIIIRSPWYATWWAYGIYLILLGSATIAFFRLQVTRKLASAEAQRLKTLDDVKSKFFANISHEFRTPLTVILGTSEQLEEDVQIFSEDKHREKALRKTTLIKRNGENLLRLINQILDLSKLESSIIRPSYIHGDVVAFLKYIGESLQSLAEAEGITLRYETEVKALMMDYDPDRLMQIVYNLLSNAIKFTPQGGQVLLAAGKRSRFAGPVFSIEVADTGAGISAEDQERIFDRFYQAGNQQYANSGGTGIGLALAKELIVLMGGEIRVQSPDSVTRVGSRFTVLLPISHNEEKAHRPVVVPFHEQELFHERHPDQVPANKQAPHLLLIEDNPDVMEYLNICLSNDYVLDFAYNGVRGIEKAFEIIPDLILSDVMMPGKDGFEVCETLKNDIRTSHIPIILLTARASVEDRIMGLKRGADAYLAKPFQREELIEWIRQLIARREILRSRYADSTQDIQQESASPELELEDAFIVGLRAVLASHYTDDKFSVNDLAREMKMSRTQVHRKLSALYGGSTTEFINSFRLEKAKEFLESGDCNVSEAAFASGFGTAKYFSRLFQEKYGILPNALLKK